MHRPFGYELRAWFWRCESESRALGATDHASRPASHEVVSDRLRAFAPGAGCGARGATATGRVVNLCGNYSGILSQHVFGGFPWSEDQITPPLPSTSPPSQSTQA